MRRKLTVFVALLIYWGLWGPLGEIGPYASCRKSVIAGSWYPGTRQGILQAMDSMGRAFKAKKGLGYPPGKRPVLVIAPHASWKYSGQVAYEALSILKPFKGKITTVFLLAPSHRVGFRGASCPRYSHYETPLGLVSLDEKRCQELRELPFVTSNERAHALEHAIEVELPFLQYFLGEFKLVPILISMADISMLQELGKKIARLMDEKSIIVISSDFTHYGPQYGYMPFGHLEDGRAIEELDMEALSWIKALDPVGFKRFVTQRHATICGRWPIVAGLYAINERFPRDQVFVHMIAYAQSGQMTHDFTNSVSYLALDIEYLEPERYLPALARRSIEAALGLGPVPKKDEVGDASFYKRHSGCFVTIETLDGRLRGCIGLIRPVRSLWECVYENAVNAAFRDPRFLPLGRDELDHIRVEVSLLTSPMPLEFKGPEELLERLKPGVHGVVLKKGKNEATFLPQVWEKLPSKEEFLSNLCIKAGMDKGCWKRPGISIFTYEAKAFSEGRRDHGP